MSKKYYKALSEPENKSTILISFGEIGESYESHSHDFSELVIITRGSAIHTVDNIDFPISKGDVFIIHKDITHEFKKAANMEMYNISFQPEVFNTKENELKKIPGFQALFFVEPYYRTRKLFKCMLHLGPGQFKNVLNIIKKMESENRAGIPGSELIIEALFIQLIIFLSRQYQNTSRNQHHKNLLQIARAAAMLEENFSHHLTLDELADTAHLSIRQFSRIFKEAYGTSPGAYLLQLRIQHACALLSDKSKNITEIAYTCGFSDSNYFARQFKKLTGLTARKYRKRELMT
ncbi:MAG: helix-turn-helix domain-containing protein [Planctomycetota bacterium]|jgi:AraC family L-rhamnose operon transcriptional activator RhaR/AraC family L-rhamnose operon regulatory protein RhaS